MGTQSVKSKMKGNAIGQITQLFQQTNCKRRKNKERKLETCKQNDNICILI